MTVDELIEQLRKMPRRPIVLCADEVVSTLKKGFVIIGCMNTSLMIKK